MSRRSRQREYLHFSEANSESQVSSLNPQSAKKLSKIQTGCGQTLYLLTSGYYDPMGKQSQFSVKHMLEKQAMKKN